MDLCVIAEKSDCDLFWRLHVASQFSDGNLNEFFSHENQPCPPSLSVRGKLKLGTKSDIVRCLELEDAPEEQDDTSVDVVVLRPAYTIQLLLRRALCRRPTVVGRTRTLSDYAQQVHAHYATKVGSNSVRMTAFVADLLKVNVARPSGFQLVNLVVCYHDFHKPEKQTCRNKILID